MLPVQERLKQDYADINLDNAYFQGYLGNSEVTNLLKSSFYRELIYVALTIPSSWHEINVARDSGNWPFNNNNPQRIAMIRCDWGESEKS